METAFDDQFDVPVGQTCNALCCVSAGDLDYHVTYCQLRDRDGRPWTSGHVIVFALRGIAGVYLGHCGEGAKRLTAKVVSSEGLKLQYPARSRKQARYAQVADAYTRKGQEWRRLRDQEEANAFSKNQLSQLGTS